MKLLYGLEYAYAYVEQEFFFFRKLSFNTK